MNNTSELISNKEVILNKKDERKNSKLDEENK